MSVPKASAILRRLVNNGKENYCGKGCQRSRVYGVLSKPVESVAALLRLLAHYVRGQRQKLEWVIRKKGAGIPL